MKNSDAAGHERSKRHRIDQRPSRLSVPVAIARIEKVAVQAAGVLKPQATHCPMIRSLCRIRSMADQE